MSQYAHLSTIDPDFAAAAASAPSVFPAGDTFADKRRGFNDGVIQRREKYWKPSLPKDSAYRVKDHQVPVEGGEILVRSVTPTGEGKTFPLIVWFHAGGFAFGNVDMDDFALRFVAVKLQVAILNVEYRLAPEHRFPTGLNDCYTALKWAVEHASQFSASPQAGFIVAGCSAGGNLAAVLAHRVRDDPFFEGRRLTGQLLQIPAPIVHPDVYPEEYKSELLSLEQNKAAPGLGANELRGFLGLLGASPADPELSVLLSPTKAGLPPAYIQVCGLDPLRDEAFLYEKVLRQAGVKTKIDAYQGLPHAGFARFPDLPVSRKVFHEFKGGLRWLLNGAA